MKEETHSQEVLRLLHEQVAEMCTYLGVDPDGMHDSWALRDAIVKLRAENESMRATLDKIREMAR